MSNQTEATFMLPKKGAWLKRIEREYKNDEGFLFLWPLFYVGQPEDEQDIHFPSIKEVSLRHVNDDVPRIHSSCTLGESNSEGLAADLLLLCILSGKAIPLCSKQEIDYHGMVKHGYMVRKKLTAKGLRPTVYLYWLTQKCVDTLMNKIQADPPL